jgi:hypothetical protein
MCKWTLELIKNVTVGHLGPYSTARVHSKLAPYEINLMSPGIGRPLRKPTSGRKMRNGLGRRIALLQHVGIHTQLAAVHEKVPRPLKQIACMMLAKGEAYLGTHVFCC